MREILFRGKFHDKWVEGSLLYDEENNKAFIAEHFEDEAAYLREVIPETVGQYIGLTDKNGKKIFEGDIVAYLSDDGTEELTVVAFYEKEARFVQKSTGENVAFETLLGYDVTIVGNIHDNPELLKGE